MGDNDKGGPSKTETGSTSHFHCPMLKSTNYTFWALRMKIILDANGLWETIEPAAGKTVEPPKDKLAIAHIFQSLPEDQLLLIAKCKTAKEIWDALKTRHIGVDRVQKARLQTLNSEFEMLQMREDENIDSFATKLTTLVNRASTLGATLEEAKVVRKLLNVVPDRYIQMVASLEQYSDLDTMTFDEAIGRLKTFEERIKCKKEKQVDSQERLMFARKEDWKNNRLRFDKRKLSENNFRRRPTGDTSNVKCYQCKKMGHFARKCPQKNNNDELNIIEEDLDATLLMATSDNKLQINGKTSQIKCYKCGKLGHYAYRCPKKKKHAGLLTETGDEGMALLMCPINEN